MTTQNNQENLAPLVSCIIIFLNAEKFLQEAIDSVFSQTYTNWELLLVDDGSTDRSSNIACNYANSHPNKVRYLEHENRQNRGMSASRNLGIYNSKGKYIALLDSDDVWLPSKLEEQLETLNLHPNAAIVYGPALNWFSWSKNSPGLKDFIDYVRYPDQLVKPPLLVTRFLTGEDFIPGPSSILVERSIVEEIGGFEENFRDLYEDQAFYSKLFLVAPAFIASQCWFKYRQHEDSCCSLAARQGKENYARKTFLEWLNEFLYENNVNDINLRHIVKRELWHYQHPSLYKIRFYIDSLVKDKRLVLKSTYKYLRAHFSYSLRPLKEKNTSQPPLGKVNFGDLKRIWPICRDFGLERGLPIDRYYIEDFVSHYVQDIQGCALEIQEPLYINKFGRDKVTKIDVLHVEEGNPNATIVGDLTRADCLASNSYDCVVLTQTLQFVYDVQAVIKTIHRILKPGGALLITVSGISQISRGDMDRSGHYWSFTTLSLQRLLHEVFDKDKVEVKAYGNVLSAISLLHGIVTEELDKSDLDYHDPDYQVLIAARALK